MSRNPVYLVPELILCIPTSRRVCLCWHHDTTTELLKLFCRDSATQLALLDQIGGMSGLAARFAAGLESLRQMEQQLADIALLGDEEERVELQEMISEVCVKYCTSMSLCYMATMCMKYY